MTAPYLVPCLVTLRAEFNALNPSRDKASDGWIGDTAHQAETSDHNPDSAGRVLAIDVDATGPWPVPFADLVEHCRGDSRLEYVIYNRRIASRDQGWTWRTYTGTSDPHISHAHFSARHDHTGGTSTAPWHLEDVDMPTAQEVADAILGTKLKDSTGADIGTVGGVLATLFSRTRADALGAATWNYQLEDPTSTTDPKVTKSAGAYQRYIDVVVGNAATEVIEALEPAPPPTTQA